MAEVRKGFEEFLEELSTQLLSVRADRPGSGVVIDAVTELGGTDLDSLTFVVRYRNERDGSTHEDRWAGMGEIWIDFDTPSQIAVFVINDLHEKLFAID